MHKHAAVVDGGMAKIGRGVTTRLQAAWRPPPVNVRQLHLRRALYRWVDCRHAGRHGWDHYSYLHDLSFGGYAWRYGDFIKGNSGDGPYHMGSTLDNVRDRRPFGASGGILPVRSGARPSLTFAVCGP